MNTNSHDVRYCPAFDIVPSASAVAVLLNPNFAPALASMRESQAGAPQYPEFSLSYQSTQDALAEVVQADAETARSRITKGNAAGAFNGLPRELRNTMPPI